ncbi:MAG: ABC transporter permease [Prevotellaceae bacterium]|jgi:putative ABC transport system permease protein|nr:ABC transporter permease [Prevotellaceae bacterium]
MITTFRYFTRDKVFSLINMLGLTIGFTAVLYIGCYIAREVTYDNFHKDGAYIYRVSTEATVKGESSGEHYVITPPIGPAMKSNLPEVEEYVRIATPRTYHIAHHNEFFKTDNVGFADTSFFRFFTFPLVEGAAANVLAAPYSIVLTEETAVRIFGNDDPLGKTVRIDGKEYNVTGVAKNPPQNSENKFNALISFSTLYRMPDRYMGWNGGNQYITYVRLSPHAEAPAVSEKLNNLLDERFGEDYRNAGITIKAFLRPMRDLHLHYSYESRYLRIILYVLSAMALLIVVVAVINFVNLTTARSLKRIKEASVRKAFGARRFNLIKQFLGESLFVSLTAYVAALLLFKLLEPVYVALTHSRLVVDENSLFVFGVVFLLALLTGVAGGCYPVFRLSSIPIQDVAKGGSEQKRKKHVIQNILIVLQLVISVVLIILTLVVTFQLSYVRDKDVGFTKEGILILNLVGKAEQQASLLLKERLAAIPEISAVSASSELPYGDFTRNGYLLPEAENFTLIHVVEVDDDFLNVYNLKVKTGRFFSRDREADKSAYLVNEKLALLLGGTEEAIGQKIKRSGPHDIIGVVNDFNYASLYSDIQPLIISNNPETGVFGKLSIKYRTTDVAALIQQIEKTWKSLHPNLPFEYAFFDELYESQYNLERYFRGFFLCFAVITLLLAVLGMLNLMAYTTEQRKKEIGIRKTLGASVRNILALLLRETGWLVLIANLIAWPLAWYAAQLWLNNFVYRISVGWLIFALALFASVVLAVLSVGIQAFRAATANPVEAIKTE